jgi:Tfp pilus assembly protein PilO
MKKDLLRHIAGNKLVVILIVGTSLIAIIVLTIHLTFIKTTVSNTKRVYQLVQRFDTLDSIEGQIKSLKSQNEAFETQISSVKTEQEEANRLSGLMNLLNREIASNKLVAVTIKTLSEKAQGDYIEQPVELHLAGSYHSFGKFINNLEKSHMSVRITKLEIDSRDMTSPLLDLKLSLSFYLLKG